MLHLPFYCSTIPLLSISPIVSCIDHSKALQVPHFPFPWTFQVLHFLFGLAQLPLLFCLCFLTLPFTRRSRYRAFCWHPSLEASSTPPSPTFFCERRLSISLFVLKLLLQLQTGTPISFFLTFLLAKAVKAHIFVLLGFSGLD